MSRRTRTIHINAKTMPEKVHFLTCCGPAVPRKILSRFQDFLIWGGPKQGALWPLAKQWHNVPLWSHPLQTPIALGGVLMPLLIGNLLFVRETFPIWPCVGRPGQCVSQKVPFGGTVVITWGVDGLKQITHSLANLFRASTSSSNPAWQPQCRGKRQSWNRSPLLKHTSPSRESHVRFAGLIPKHRFRQHRGSALFYDEPQRWLGLKTSILYF